MRHHLSKLWSLAAVAMVSCGGPLEPSDIAGTYTATLFTISGEESGDVLAAGGSLQLVLEADGSTSGTMVIPAVFSEDGVEVSLDLTGTFTVNDAIVSFNHVADTFVRDVMWEVDGSTLRTDATFSDTSIEVVLTRQ
jgi:hypothetical protein